MAKIADYLPAPAGGLEGEIKDASQQQQERLRDPTSGQFIVDPASTPNVDWEKRYLELEQHNSRQAQTLGLYKQQIDTFITNPTPATPEPQVAPEPITMDALYEDPNAAIHQAVDQHPVVQEARALTQRYEADRLQRDADAFGVKHPDAMSIKETPEFQNWVVADATRMDLYTKGNQYDFHAADALFHMFKTEKGLANVTTQQAVQQAELVSSSGELVQEPAVYSRQEYIQKLMRSKQGDLEAEAWVKANAANYRIALGNGNVRD